MNDSLTFDQLIEEMCNDPLFVQACEENNRQWEEECAAELDITVDELITFLNND